MPLLDAKEKKKNDPFNLGAKRPTYGRGETLVGWMLVGDDDKSTPHIDHCYY
jgi:hypothetical protein